MTERSELPVQAPGLSGRINGLSVENEDALRILQHNWHQRYLVYIGRVAGDLKWQAARVGDAAKPSLQADRPEELNEKLAEDNSQW